MQVKALNAVAAITFAAFAGIANAAVVEFHIRAGTASNRAQWNNRAETVNVKIGDTLRLINDDSVVHALHTDEGVPCEHGADMAPRGGSYDCVIAEAYDSNADGPLIDHYFHDAKFWLVATP